VAPIVHLVRHGQGENNLPDFDFNTRDPPLTALGQQQCRDLCKNFPYHSSVDAIIASPLRRTLQTALIGFEPELKRGIKVIALPEAQEISEFGADTGSNPGALAKAFGGLPVDLSLVHEGWNSKTGKYGRSIEAIDKRAEEVRTLLWVRPEKEVVLVSHMGFLHHLTDDWEGGLGNGWKNAEFRTYQLVDGKSGKISLLETDGSRALRGAGPRLSVEEQLKLREKLTKEWFEIEAYLKGERD